MAALRNLFRFFGLVGTSPKTMNDQPCEECGGSGHIHGWLCPDCKNGHTAEPPSEAELEALHQSDLAYDRAKNDGSLRRAEDERALRIQLQEGLL